MADATTIDPPLYGRTKRHPWLWGVAHTRDFNGEPRTWLRSEHMTREAAEVQFAIQTKFATIERVSNPSRDHRLLETTMTKTTLPPIVPGVGHSSMRCLCGYPLVEGNYCSDSGASWTAKCPNPANPEAIPYARYS